MDNLMQRAWALTLANRPLFRQNTGDNKNVIGGIMGFFESDNSAERQIEIYEELKADKQDKINELSLSASDPDVAAKIDNLEEQIKQLELNIEQTREGAERAGKSLDHEPDDSFFED